MCTALIISGPGLSLAGADTRHLIDGRLYDLPGRLRRVPGGWCSTTGDAAVVLRGLRELETAGVAGAEDAIDTAVRECAFHREPNSASRFMIVADSGELIEVRTDQPVWREPAPPTGYRYSYQPPPGLADGGKRAWETMLDALGTARRIEDVVRAVAGIVRDGHAQGGRQSAAIELGITIDGQRVCYCHQQADVLARATDGAIARVFSAPPTLPAFPRMESERLIFSLPIKV